MNGNDIPLGNTPTPRSKQQNFRYKKFQIIPDTVMSSKPALLSGCDSERLGLLRVPSNVHRINLNETDHGQAKIPDPPPLPLTNSSFIGTYGPQLQGRGCLGPHVHFQSKTRFSASPGPCTPCALIEKTERI